MPTRRLTQVKVMNDDKVVKSFSFYGDADSDVTMKVSYESKLPDRNPLHEKALNFEDLKPGLNIQQHHINGNSYKSLAIINGEPFKRGTKYGVWVVPVVTTYYPGKLAKEDWFLNDMGIVPYEGHDGSQWWSEQYYTLAVS